MRHKIRKCAHIRTLKHNNSIYQFFVDKNYSVWDILVNSKRDVELFNHLKGRPIKKVLNTMYEIFSLE